MSKKRWPRGSGALLWLLMILSLVQLSCTLLSPDDPSIAETRAPSWFGVGGEPTPTEKAPPSEKEASRPEEAPRPPTEAGIACMGSPGNGVTCLGPDGWQRYTRDNSPLGGDYVKRIAVCPDKRVLFLHSGGISAFDGETWKEYQGGWGPGSGEALACDFAGGIWVAHFQGVSYYDGSSWATFPASELATGSEASDLVRDLALDLDGKVWVVTAKSVAVRQDGEWTVYQKGQGFEETLFFDRVALDGFGRPWVAFGRGVLLFDDGVWKSFETPGFFTVESLVVDYQVRPWLGTLNDGAFVLEEGGWLTFDETSSELPGRHVQDIAVDAMDRVWLGTEWGLAIYDGMTWHSYRMDNADLTDNDISAVAVVGSGPLLPAPLEKEPGSMRGQIVCQDGQPLARAEVEICVEALGSWYYGETFCSDQPFIARAETNDAGDFEVLDLPAGYYIVTVNTGETWARLSGDLGFVSKRALVEAGRECDLGELILSAEDPPLP